MDLRRGVGLRRVKALIRGLPADSALGRELSEDEPAPRPAVGHGGNGDDEHFEGFRGMLRAVKG